MFEKKVQNLKLGESIGYTFKCLGAGFWAFKQKNFRTAIQELTMEVVKYLMNYITVFLINSIKLEVLYVLLSRLVMQTRTVQLQEPYLAVKLDITNCLNLGSMVWHIAIGWTHILPGSVKNV
jgi:hypothetical protein